MTFDTTIAHVRTDLIATFAQLEDLFALPADIRQCQPAPHEWCISQIQKGQGALHKVRMSVQSLGKLNIYEWLYFLVHHAKRHLVEIERIQIVYTEAFK